MRPNLPSGPPGTISPDLRPVAADLHRAPTPAAVAGVVVERPPATVTGAHLEPVPRTGRGRGGDARHHPPEGAVDAAGRQGRHFGPAVDGQLHLQRPRPQL